MSRTAHSAIARLLLIAAVAACTVDKGDSGATAGATAGTASAPITTGPTTGATTTTQPAAPSTASDTRLEVDVKARTLHVLKGTDTAATHKVAVGSEKWPTQTGEWKVTQVVWNPAWTPPDESWAEEREPREPGDPKNPLGRVQLVYDPPRSIHGTNQPSSIGKAVSHGSIRMRNEELEHVAMLVMEAGGAPKDQAWVDGVKKNRTKKEVVDLPNPVTIRVY